MPVTRTLRNVTRACLLAAALGALPFTLPAPSPGAAIAADIASADRSNGHGRGCNGGGNCCKNHADSSACSADVSCATGPQLPECVPV